MASTSECINTIRCFAADVVQNAKSGHPGAPMGLAPTAHILFSKYLRFNPKNDKWPNRDRFFLSNGHASALLYLMMHLAGNPFWTLDVLKTFRRLESPAAGHPEGHYPGIETSTGPLGQGFANGVGAAIAEAHLEQRFNRDGFNLINNYTYVFCGDGCLHEGITAEAASLAGHLGLGKLIVLYDDNHVTIDGSTELAWTEDVIGRFKAYGWHTQKITKGDNDVDAIDRAISEAKSVKDKPSFIQVTTTIGYGSDKQGTCKVHGTPLGEEDVANVKRKFGMDPEEKFVLPDSVRQVYDMTEKGEKYESEWNDLVERYTKKYPTEAAEFKRRFDGTLPEGWDKDLPTFSQKDDPVATRISSGKILNHFAEKIPEIFGGSADLNPSCYTYLKFDKDFQKGSYDQRNVRFGVREHSMAAICNGISSYGGIIPFCSTFLNFIGYALGAVVLSAMTGHQVLYIFTHDSIFLGEDGPTHQPIEKAAICRAMPNLHFWRPADGNETVAAYVSAIRSRQNPTAFSLSRQNLPHLRGSSTEKALRGGYIIKPESEGDKPDLILVSTGSETHICVEAAQKSDLKIRVVSLPCWELFDEQPLDYRTRIFPDDVPVLSVEAGVTMGWSKYAHSSIGIDRFGLSGSVSDLQKHFKLTPDDIVHRSKEFADQHKQRTVQSKLLQ